MSSRRQKRRGSNTSQPSPWSVWAWNEKYHIHSRYRVSQGPNNVDGYEWDYAARDEDQSNYTHDSRELKRASGASFETNVAEDEPIISPQASTTTSTTALSMLSITCSSPECTHVSGSMEDQDRHYKTIHSRNGERPHVCTIDGCQAGVKSWTTLAKLRAHNNKWHGPYHCVEPGCSRSVPNGFGLQAELDAHVKSAHQGCSDTEVQTKDVEEDVTDGHNLQIKLKVTSDSHPGNADLKDGQMVWEDTYVPALQSSLVDATLKRASHDLKNQRSTPDQLNQLDEGKQAILKEKERGILSNNQLHTDNPEGAHAPHERFDKMYKIHKEHEFKAYRVFKVIWSEPEGDHGNGSQSHSTESIRHGRNGIEFHEKVRRFVIISPMRGHCLCLPLDTYPKQATLKSGVYASDHAVAYSNKAEYLPGEIEKGLIRKPIRIQPSTPRDRLDSATRLNYAKVYTVEYNVKVCFIGKVHEDSRNQIALDYNDVHPPMTVIPYEEPTLLYRPEILNYTGGWFDLLPENIVDESSRLHMASCTAEENILPDQSMHPLSHFTDRYSRLDTQPRLTDSIPEEQESEDQRDVASDLYSAD